MRPTRLRPTRCSALADGSVRGIVIDIDSLCGGLQAVAELADEIYRARGGKPIAAVANSIAARAAYWFASTASEFQINQAAISGRLACSPHIRTARKRWKPKARQHLQARVNDHYDRFARAVARNRGVDAATVRHGFGQGRVLGARAAKDAVMVDDIAIFDDVVGKLARRIGPARPKPLAIGPRYRPYSRAQF
ncbi:MAG TPA: S49 family peptidase [Paraburkholderia sp.]